MSSFRLIGAIPQFIERDGCSVPNPEYAGAKYALVWCDENGKPLKGFPEVRSNNLDYLQALQIQRINARNL